MTTKLTVAFILLSHLACAQAWVQLPDFPGAERDDGVGIAINNKAYFGTGLQPSGLSADFYALNLSSLTWSAMPAMPFGSQRQYAAVFEGSPGFYVVGGEGTNGYTNSMYRYDIIYDYWTAAAPMPGNGVMGMSCLALGNEVICVGGKFQDGTINNKVWKYDVAADTWTPKNDFPYGGRWRAGATVINGLGYLMGGIDGSNRFRRELFFYNPYTDTWQQMDDFPAGGRAYAAFQGANNTLITFGGWDSANVHHNDVWMYNLSNNNWSQQQSLPSFGRKGGMSAVSGNKFYYTCGVTPTERIKETWMMDVVVGIKENSGADLFSVHPNPVNELLHINMESNAGIHEINVIDIAGRPVSAAVTEMNNNNMQVNMTGLDQGIYFIQVKSTAGFSVKKIVKK